MDFLIIMDYSLAFYRDLLQMPSFRTSKEPLVVVRCGYSQYSLNPKDCTLVFDHLATTHRKLLDMTIVFTSTREKVFIVTGDRH